MAEPGLRHDAEGEPLGLEPLTAVIRFAHQPNPLDVTRLAAELSTELGAVDAREGLLILRGLGEQHSQMPLAYLVPEATPVPDPDPLLDALRLTQLWRVGDRREELICAGGWQVLFAEMLVALLPPAERVRALGAVIQGALRQWPDAVAVLFSATGDLYSAEALRAQAGDPRWWGALAMNVRFFTIADSPTGDMVFDTLGLHALELPEVQVHYRGLTPSDVASFTRNVGIYLLEHGDVITDGHTVEGIDGSRWPCRHEAALIQPPRLVLDVNPGPYAAGDRS